MSSHDPANGRMLTGAHTPELANKGVVPDATLVSTRQYQPRANPKGSAAAPQLAHYGYQPAQGVGEKTIGH